MRSTSIIEPGRQRPAGRADSTNEREQLSHFLERLNDDELDDLVAAALTVRSSRTYLPWRGGAVALEKGRR